MGIRQPRVQWEQRHLDRKGDGESEGGALATARAGGAVSTTTTKREPVDRTDDPVRMYLREMGSVELLSREGEIAIAKRIEAGRETMIEGLRGALRQPDAEVQLRFREADFPDGHTMTDFASQVGIDIPVEDVEQEGA